MIYCVPFRPSHFAKIKNPRFGDYLSTSDIHALSDNPYSATVFNNRKEVLACFGFVKMWENRAECWAMLNEGHTDEFLGLHRLSVRLLDAAPFRRIEATVEQGFTAGFRWIEMLGFKRESNIMRNYFPDGKNAVLYARLKGEGK